MIAGIKNFLTLLVALLWVNGACAQTYNQMTWGFTLPSGSPYNFGANIQGNWYNLGSISSTGAWTLILNGTGLTPPTTSRAPLLIWNNPNGSTPAGYNAGLQIAITDNLVGTPGAGDTVGLTLGVSNGNNRVELYSENIVIGQCGTAEGCPSTYLDGNAVGLEIDGYTSASFSVANQAFKPTSGIYAKNLLELYTQGPQHFTSDISIWSTVGDGSNWPYEGIELSRVVNNGIHFHVNPTIAVTDSAAAFTNAAIFDESNSSRSLRIKGSHYAAISVEDNPTLGLFIAAPYHVDGILRVGNISDNNLTWMIDTGVTTSKTSQISFADQNVQKWNIGKSSANDFFIYNISRGAFDFNILNANGSAIFYNALTAASVRPSPTAFASLAACAVGNAGTIDVISDGATYAGGATGTAASGGGTSYRVVLCTNARAGTYEWDYN